jgi:hypothetical protein
MNGWEADDIVMELVSGNIDRNDTLNRENQQGTGGLIARGANGPGGRSVTGLEISDFDTQPITDFFIQVPMRRGNAGAFLDVEFMDGINNGNSGIIAQLSLNATGTIAAKRNTSTIATSSTTIDLNAWSLIEARIYLHDTNGRFIVYNNGDYSNPIIDFTGDTIGGTAGSDKVFALSYNWQNFALTDDIIINDIRMTYSGGIGSRPALPFTITGGTSSSTAEVIGYGEGSTDSAGTLILADVRDSGSNEWSGLETDDVFATDGSISSGGWSANIANPAGNGVDHMSWLCQDMYVTVHKPNGNGDSSDLDGSDGNQIDNYLLVDDLPGGSSGTESEYVEGQNNGEQDLYNFEDGPSSLLVEKFGAVKIITHAEQTGIGLTKQRLIAKGTAQSDGPERDIPSTGFAAKERFMNYTADDTDWTITLFNSHQFGFKVET